MEENNQFVLYSLRTKSPTRVNRQLRRNLRYNLKGRGFYRGGFLNRDDFSYWKIRVQILDVLRKMERGYSGTDVQIGLCMPTLDELPELCLLADETIEFIRDGIKSSPHVEVEMEMCVNDYNTLKGRLS